MILMKCKCGCFFTVEESAFKMKKFVCQNCGNVFSNHPQMEQHEMQNELNQSGYQLQIIPDEAKIRVEYTI